MSKSKITVEKTDEDKKIDVQNEKEFLEGAQHREDDTVANPYAPHSTPYVAYELGVKFGEADKSVKVVKTTEVSSSEF